jgi:hypothetical protein
MCKATAIRNMTAFKTKRCDGRGQYGGQSGLDEPLMAHQGTYLRNNRYMNDVRPFGRAAAP